MPSLNLGKVKGDKGDKGDAATITVGTVATVVPTDPAEVENGGTSGAAVLNFKIPQGIQGQTGPMGPAIESLIINEGTTARTLSLTDVNQYIRCTNASQTTITIPAEASVSWPTGTVIYFRRANGPIEIIPAPASGVTITGESSQSILVNQNFAIKKVGTNVWDLI